MAVAHGAVALPAHGGQPRLGGGFVLPPRLIERNPDAAEPDLRRRTKLWEFSTNLHCSIVGTCLSTAELRQVLGKLGTVTPGATDHDLHHTAVALAARHDQPARLLHKALDQRHKLAINRFGKLAEPAAIGTLWREAVKRGDIPGAYWAVLTHPATTPELVRLASARSTCCPTWSGRRTGRTSAGWQRWRPRMRSTGRSCRTSSGLCITP